MIRKVPGGYRLLSHTGKNLGTSRSKTGAEHREQQVQFFKNKEKFERDHPGRKFPPK